MSRNTGNKSNAPRKSGSSLLTGILVGMVIGVAMAAGLVWYIMKSPSPFVQKEWAVAKPPLAADKPAAAPPAATPGAQPDAAPGVVDNKPRFEFYKVLTDKQEAADTPAKPADKPAPKESKPHAADVPAFLQAGSFTNVDDAEKLKAKLALLGIEAGIQTVTIPDKGVWHRVRLGPYKNADEMNRMRNMLKQNGVEATPTRAQ